MPCMLPAGCSLDMHMWCAQAHMPMGESLPETKPVGGPLSHASGSGCGAALVLTFAWYFSWQPWYGKVPLPVAQPLVSGHQTHTLHPVSFL